MLLSLHALNFFTASPIAFQGSCLGFEDETEFFSEGQGLS